MSFYNCTLVTAIATASLSSFGVSASTNEIEQIIVSGTRSEQPSVQIPASIQVVTAEDIKLSGASSLIQILNAQAGIQINDLIGAGSRATSISMRGFGENNVNNVLVLVDGRKLNNPSLAGPDLSAIALKDVERVEIIQGSAGTLFGDQATGGVINVITKRSKELSASVKAGRGTDDLEVYRGSISHGLDNGLFYRVSAEKVLEDNYRVNNEANYSNVLANVGYEQTSFRLFAEILQVEDKLNLPGSLNRANIASDRKQTFNPSEFTNQSSDAYRIGGDVHLTDNWTISAEYTDRETDSAGQTSWGFDWTGTTSVETLNPRAVGIIATANGDILVTSGFDLQESEYQSDLTGSDSEQSLSDFYAQVVVPVTAKISVTAGGRYSELEETDNLSGTDNDDDISVFQIGAAYQVNADTRLFLRRDEGFRWANIDENGYSDQPVGEILAPQESTSWEAGVETRIDAVSFSALLYQMTIDNEIYYDPTVNLFGANSNLDESDRVGIVLDSRWKVSERINLQINYSYVDAEVSAGLYSGNTVPFVASQTANLLATFVISDNWSIYVDAQHTGSRYGANDDANSNGELGGYTLYNANINWQYHQFSVNFRANNLTGKKYNGFESTGYNYAYPAKEETFEITAGYTF